MMEIRKNMKQKNTLCGVFFCFIKKEKVLPDIIYSISEVVSELITKTRQRAEMPLCAVTWM